MNILVTGHLGYIGPHLVKLLKEHNHRVTGCDLWLYKEAIIEDLPEADHFLCQDFRDLSADDLKKYDVVCHLAAISNDAMGEIDSKLTRSINFQGSLDLAKKAKAAGVPRFIFSSSCSIYGKGSEEMVTESSLLNPLTEYAKSKIDAETEISKLYDSSFTPIFLRNATAFGDSPVFRTDLVVNNLLGSALAYGKILIKSDGAPWRPLIHCHDIARAFRFFSEIPSHEINERTINIGRTGSNFQVREIADKVKQLQPSAIIEFTGEIGVDPRDYKVSFERLEKNYNPIDFQFNLGDGMKILNQKMLTLNFSAADFESDRFVRLKLLKKNLHLLHA